MKSAEHITKAKEFLNQAEIGYINGDDEFEVCGIFWEAAAHVVQAAALRRGLDCDSLEEQTIAAKSLIKETGDPEFSLGFTLAENMYAHSLYGFFHSFDDRDVAAVRYFVNRMAALALAPPDTPDLAPSVAADVPPALASNFQEVAG